MNLDLLFKIAGVGILISVFHTALKQAGKEDMAHLCTLAGFTIVLFGWFNSSASCSPLSRPSLNSIEGAGMEIIQIVGLGFIVTLLILIIRGQRPEIAVQISITLATVIFLLVLAKIEVVLNLFRDLADKANISQMYLNTILKIIGIAYITEFGAQVCRDAGEGAVAGKIEFAGKVLVMVMAIPIIALVLETIVRLVP
jgi:stage III sporulation protein AD